MVSRDCNLQEAAYRLSSCVLEHPFMVRCGSGAITDRELRRFLAQHSRYSAHFVRYLCGVISNLQEPAEVSRLAENLAEELGYGSDDRIPHSSIYANMLKELEVDIREYPENPETGNLIETMLMLCSQPKGTAGLGALYLGAEAIVPPMYTRLLMGFRHCGYDANDLRFFSIHVECDDGHAHTMQEIMARRLTTSPEIKEAILNAGRIAIQARLRFLDALLDGGAN
jgi:pyrroloquinoline-quinone synthase